VRWQKQRLTEFRRQHELSPPVGTRRRLDGWYGLPVVPGQQKELLYAKDDEQRIRQVYYDSVTHHVATQEELPKQVQAATQIVDALNCAGWDPDDANPILLAFASGAETVGDFFKMDRSQCNFLLDCCEVRGAKDGVANDEVARETFKIVVETSPWQAYWGETSWTERMATRRLAGTGDAQPALTPQTQWNEQERPAPLPLPFFPLEPGGMTQWLTTASRRVEYLRHQPVTNGVKMTGKVVRRTTKAWVDPSWAQAYEAAFPGGEDYSADHFLQWLQVYYLDRLYAQWSGCRRGCCVYLTWLTQWQKLYDQMITWAQKVHSLDDESRFGEANAIQVFYDAAGLSNEEEDCCRATVCAKVVAFKTRRSAGYQDEVPEADQHPIAVTAQVCAQITSTNAWYEHHVELSGSGGAVPRLFGCEPAVSVQSEAQSGVEAPASGPEERKETSPFGRGWGDAGKGKAGITSAERTADDKLERWPGYPENLICKGIWWDERNDQMWQYATPELFSTWKDGRRKPCGLKKEYHPPGIDGDPCRKDLRRCPYWHRGEALCKWYMTTVAKLVDNEKNHEFRKIYAAKRAAEMGKGA